MVAHETMGMKTPMVIALGTGTLGVLQAVIGPDSLMPLGVGLALICSVATGAAVAAWRVRGVLDKIERHMETSEKRDRDMKIRLDEIEVAATLPCDICPYRED